MVIEHLCLLNRIVIGQAVMNNTFETAGRRDIDL